MKSITQLVCLTTSCGSLPGPSCENGFMSGSRVSVQQQNDVTEVQAASLQVGLHVLHQRSPDVHRLVRVHSGRRLLLSSHDLHNERGGQMFKLFCHDHLVKVGLLHHKVKAMFLKEETFVEITGRINRCEQNQTELERP